MAVYRYLTTDLLTNTVIGELPLTNVTYQQTLNQAGSFSGQLLLTDSRVEQTLGTYNSNNVFTLDYVTAGGRCGLYVERDGVLVWGGIIWSRQYSSSEQTLEINASELESYFAKRRVNKDVVYAANTDQISLIADLVTTSKVGPNADIGITAPTGTSIGIPNPYQILNIQKRPILDVIVELSRQSPPYGFDFSVDVSYGTNNVIQKTLNIYYPRKGRLAGSASYLPMLEFPGSILTYTYPEDAGSMANTLHAFGPYEYISTATSSASFANGFPVLEDSVSLVQIPNPRVIDSMATAEVQARDEPLVTMNAAWFPSYDSRTGLPAGPMIGEFQVGDVFRIRITDPRFPNTFETALRLQSANVSVGDNGEAEIVNGVFVAQTY